MSIETESIAQLSQQSNRLSKIIGEREVLFDRIGTGDDVEIKMGTSIRATLKVGIAKRTVRQSIIRLSGRFLDVDDELTEYTRAEEYLGDLEMRRGQITAMSELVNEGYIPSDVFQTHKAELDDLISLPERDPQLKRGLDLVALVRKEEEERSKKAEGKRKRPSQEQKEGFHLPSGTIVADSRGRLLSLLSAASMEQPVSTIILIRELYPGVDPKIAIRRLSNLISRTRDKVRVEGWSIENMTDRSDRALGTQAVYYLRRTIPTQVTPEGPISAPINPQPLQPVLPVQPLKPRVVEEPQHLEETAEFGTLSRSDVAVIAAAMSFFYDKLEAIFAKANLQLIKKDTLNAMVAQIMPEEGEIRERKNGDKDSAIRQMRNQAFTRVTALLEDANIDSIFDAIYEKSADVWELFMNLQEIKEVGQVRTKGATYPNGIAFLKDFLLDPDVRNQQWTVVQDTDRQSEGVVFQETSTPAAVAGGTIRDKAPEPVSPLERRDPEVRVRINVFLDVIMNKQELSESASPGTVTLAFPVLKKNIIDKNVEEGFVKPDIDPNKEDQRKYSAWHIAILLYLNRYGKNFSSQIKKDVQKIAKEEYQKRLARSEESGE